MTLPCASWYMVAVALAGAFSRKSRKCVAAVFHADEHESAAAEISGLRVHDRQCETRRDRRVDGVTTGLHDLHAGAGGELVNAGDHAVLGHFGAHAAAGEGELRGGSAGQEHQRGV